MKLWTEDEETVIRCLIGRHKVKTLCAILDRSYESVRGHIKEMRREGRLLSR